MAQPHLNLKLPRHRQRKIAAKLLKLGRPTPRKEATSVPPIRIVCISDTHNLCPTLPFGDVLIHAGDLSEWGSFDEVQAQITWLSQQPHQHKLVIAGNHDLLFDSEFLESHPQYQDPQNRTRRDLVFGTVTYLQDESITISFPERKTSLNVHGSPWTPRYGTSAFQYDRHRDVWSNRVPEITDILITHGPPARFRNIKPSAGCAYLRDEVARVKPKLVVFGHIHHARGEQTITFDGAQSLHDDIIDGSRGWDAVPLLFVASIWSCLRHIVGKPVQSTRMIDAAVVDGMKKDVALDAFLLDL